MKNSIPHSLQDIMKVTEEARVLSDSEVTCIIAKSVRETSEKIYKENVRSAARPERDLTSFLDNILTSPVTGYMCMALLLLAVFWITLVGANWPSSVLFELLFAIESRFVTFLNACNAKEWFIGITVFGAYRSLAWVISVMLPPIAIFFPCFTLLEDLGYLPRIAFNLDTFFKRVGSHGKQALTMCMGFGCNAAGVVACRIIDSPREVDCAYHQHFCSV